ADPRALLSFPTRRSSDLAPPEDLAMLALMLQLPGEGYIAEQYEVVEVEAIHAARKTVAGQVGQALKAEFTQCLLDYDHRRDYSRSEEHTSELQSRENIVC